MKNLNLIILLSVAIMFIYSCKSNIANNEVSKKIQEIDQLTADAEEYVNLFQTTNDSSNLIKAAQKIDYIFDQGIRSISLYKLKSRVLRRSCRFNDNAALMKEASSLFPDNPHALFGAAISFEKINDLKTANQLYEKSIAAINKQIEKFPSTENYMTSITLTCILQGQEVARLECEKISKSGVLPPSSIRLIEGITSGFNRTRFVNSVMMGR